MVNPIAAIMAARMMFDYLGEKATGARIEKAITDVLVEGKVRTYDLGGTSTTSQVAEAISEKLRRDGEEIGRLEIGRNYPSLANGSTCSPS